MAQPVVAPAGSFAQQFGVKALVFGPPGRAKTPLAATAPNPILCFTEPGMLSMRGSNVPACQAFTRQDIADFYTWLGSSAEAKKYDTVCIDSLSQQAEVILRDELPKQKDPRKAYGIMTDTMMGYINQLYFTREKHAYLICKQELIDEGTPPSIIRVRSPQFPGQSLYTQVVHLFDEILQVDLNYVPGQQGAVLSFRCHPSFDVRCRDRSGRLAEYEPANLTHVFNKILQG